MTIHSSRELEPHRRDGFPSAPISVLTYQSKVVKHPTSVELHALLRQAKARNRASDVTGMLVFKEDQFFQWLEGPSDALDSIWTSIQNDLRHKEIELLNRSEAQQRLFNQWDMRFACPEDAFCSARDHMTPQARLPIKLIEQAAALAVDQRTGALQDGIEEILHMGFDMMSIYSGLAEPVAHRLGDMWMEDACSNAEISVALGCLQNAVRGVSRRHAGSVASTSPRHILVMPPPGETHMLGVALVGDLYREAGWLVDVEFPASDEEVCAAVQTQWFDAVSFCISDAFTRGNRIDAFAMMICKVRQSSVNPNLVIMVGGRTFAERPDLTALVGADASYSNVAYAVENTRICFKGTGIGTALS